MDETGSTPPATQTNSLIASDRIEGTKVFGRDGDRLGAVHHFMIDKTGGQVAYVVISTGGFLGLGQAYHPLPWSMFRYDENQSGYVVQVDRRLLDGSPSYRPDSAPDFDDAYGRRVSDYFAASV